MIVFGGAACEGEMGIELARQFPEIDYVFLGEADLSFPVVVEAILARRGRAAELPPGVVRREPTGAVSVGAVAQPKSLLL